MFNFDLFDHDSTATVEKLLCQVPHLLLREVVILLDQWTEDDQAEQFLPLLYRILTSSVWSVEGRVQIAECRVKCTKVCSVQRTVVSADMEKVQTCAINDHLNFFLAWVKSVQNFTPFLRESK